MSWRERCVSHATKPAARAAAETMATVVVEKPTSNRMGRAAALCTAQPSAGAIGSASAGPTRRRASAKPRTVQNDAAATAHWPATTGAAPAETGEHVPVLQVMHVPVHAELQHTPCTQKPDAQSEFTPDGHRPPMGILPQLMATHVLPVTHSLLVAHVVRQRCARLNLLQQFVE